MATIADMQAYNMLQKIGPMNEGLAMAHPPGQLPPYVPPDKPSSPYQPGKSPVPSRDDKLANLPAGEADAADMYYPTEQGFFLDGTGKAFMQSGGKFYDAGDYNIEVHGLPVPLAQLMQINPDIAREFFYNEDPGGVVTPRYLTPPKLRDYMRTPGIKEEEMIHFNNFIKSLGPGLDTVKKNTPMSIASHDNRQFKSVPARGARGDTPASKEYIDGMLQRKIKPSTPNNLFGVA